MINSMSVTTRIAARGEENRKLWHGRKFSEEVSIKRMSNSPQEQIYC